MRPPYYLFYSRDPAPADQAREPTDPATARFGLIASSIILAGIVVVAFLSGW